MLSSKSPIVAFVYFSMCIYVYIQVFFCFIFCSLWVKKRNPFSPCSWAAGSRWPYLRRGVAPDDLPASATLCFWDSIPFQIYQAVALLKRLHFSFTRAFSPLCIACLLRLQSWAVRIQSFEKPVHGKKKELPSLKRGSF